MPIDIFAVTAPALVAAMAIRLFTRWPPVRPQSMWRSRSDRPTTQSGARPQSAVPPPGDGLDTNGDSASVRIVGGKERSASGVVWGPNDDPNLTDDELLSQRAAWFEWHMSLEGVYVDADGGPYHCPCCRFLTLDERGGYDSCPVCFWEDDGQDDHDADLVRGGPNGALSLTEARANFRRIGASDNRRLSFVRGPLPKEFPN